MKLNKRHKTALEFLSKNADQFIYANYGTGETTLKQLEKGGYVVSERAWVGYKWRITEKGMQMVKNLTPTNPSEALVRWNAKVKGSE